MTGNRKTVMKSFRLNYYLADSLSKASQNLGITESVYVSNILERTLKVEPITQNIEGIGLSKLSFQEILAQTNSTGLEICASEIAKQNVPFVFELLGLELTTVSLAWYIKEILQVMGWFKIGTVRVSDHELKLVHNYGLKWSRFLKSYLTSAYLLMRHMDPEIKITESMVKLSLPADSYQQLENSGQKLHFEV